MSKVFRRLLIVAIVLLAVLLAAEVGLTFAAQKGLAVYLKSRLSLPQEPHVTISSFPLTVSALRGRINSSRVEITDTARITNLAGVPTDLPYGLSVTATDLRFSLGKLASGHLEIDDIDRLEASLQLNEASLNSYFKGSGFAASLEGNRVSLISESSPGTKIECKVYVHDFHTIAVEPTSGTFPGSGNLPISAGRILLDLPVEALPMKPALLSVDISGRVLAVKARLDESSVIRSSTQSLLQL